jgi:hypothetical protein
MIILRSRAEVFFRIVYKGALDGIKLLYATFHYVTISIAMNCS